MSEETPKQKRQIRYWRSINGRLYARLQYKDEFGKPKEKLRPISDKRTARSVVEEMRLELLNHGEDTLQNDKVNFEQLAERYIKAKVHPAIIRDGMKISGLKSSRSVEMQVKNAVAYFGKKLLRSLKPADILKYKNYRLHKPVKIEVWQEFPLLDRDKKPLLDKDGNPKTEKRKVWRETTRKIASVNRDLATLRVMLNFAVDQGYLIKSPMPGKILSTASEVERDRILSHAEESLLLSFCIDERSHLRPIIICALHTAMRPEEIFNLIWRDIDFETSTITIRAENSKTEKSRIIWITPTLKDELEKVWNSSPKNLDLSVFGVKSIKTAFRSACKKAGIEDFRFRDCRHTATTRMVLAGYPHTEIMKITGHTQMKTFLRYVNLTPESMQDKSSRFEMYLESKNIIEIESTN